MLGRRFARLIHAAVASGARLLAACPPEPEAAPGGDDAPRNVDSDTSLVRNMGMRHSDLVRAHDAEVSRPDLPCTGANCISVGW